MSEIDLLYRNDFRSRSDSMEPRLWAAAAALDRAAPELAGMLRDNIKHQGAVADNLYKAVQEIDACHASIAALESECNRLAAAIREGQGAG